MLQRINYPAETGIRLSFQIFLGYIHLDTVDILKIGQSSHFNRCKCSKYASCRVLQRTILQGGRREANVGNYTAQ